MKTLCIAGKNNIAVNVLKYAIDKYSNNLNIIGICNRTDNGYDNFQLSYKRILKQCSIKEVSLDDIYEIEDLIFLSLEFDRLIKIKKFKSKKLFNVHFSLLPKYRGMYTAAWVILNNEKYTGVTLHEIDDGIDTGNIIDQLKYEISNEMTCEDIYIKNIELGTEIIKKNFDLLLNDKYKSYKQNDNDSSYYGKNSIDYNNLYIMLDEPKEIIDRKLRAYTFTYYQKPIYLNDRIIFKKQ